MKKATANLIAFGFIFIAPIIIIMLRYEQEKKVVVSEGGLPFVASALISIMILIGLFFLISLAKAKIVQDKTSSFALFIYGVIIVGVLFIALTLMNSIVQGVEYNYELFMENMAYHKNTIKYMIYASAVGVAIIFWEAPIKLINTINNLRP